MAIYDLPWREEYNRETEFYVGIGTPPSNEHECLSEILKLAVTYEVDITLLTYEEWKAFCKTNDSPKGIDIDKQSGKKILRIKIHQSYPKGYKLWTADAPADDNIVLSEDVQRMLFGEVMDFKVEPLSVYRV